MSRNSDLAGLTTVRAVGGLIPADLLTRVLAADGLAGLTAAELATLDGAYDHITAADFDAAHLWVELAERYGEVYVYPLAEPIAGASVQIEIVRTGEDLVLRTGRTGRWSALRLGEGDGDHDEAEGTGAASLVEWLASVGWVP
mgnify:CR=1 FL=1